MLGGGESSVTGVFGGRGAEGVVVEEAGQCLLFPLRPADVSAAHALPSNPSLARAVARLHLDSLVSLGCFELATGVSYLKASRSPAIHA